VGCVMEKEKKRAGRGWRMRMKRERAGERIGPGGLGNRNSIYFFLKPFIIWKLV
jgi:hypothetical protein